MFDGLAAVLYKVEEYGVLPEGRLDAYIAMSSKSDGDATPLCQRPFVFSLLSIASGHLFV